MGGGFFFLKKVGNPSRFFNFFYACTHSPRLIRKGSINLPLPRIFLLVSGPVLKYNPRGVGLALDHFFGGSIKEHSGHFF